VRFVLFDDQAAETFRGVHQEMGQKHDPQGVP
jgi:hypothetical protein